MFEAIRLARVSGFVRLPKEIVQELLKTSLEFTEVVERMEVLLDKKTVHRLKRGRKAYKTGKYVTASENEVDKVLAG